jgi:PTS system nitrogen regulatory IIA component
MEAELNMEIKDYITEQSVFHIDKPDKLGVMAELVKHALTLGKVSDAGDFRQAVLEREALVSTGIGLGVAIPHARLACISDFFIVVGILKSPVDWDAIDHKPVSIVFLIGGPEHSHGAYLQLLARIITVIKNDGKLEKLMKAATAEELAALF